MFFRVNDPLVCILDQSRLGALNFCPFALGISLGERKPSPMTPPSDSIPNPSRFQTYLFEIADI